MTKEFVPYNRALKLKELGFDKPCIACYTQNAYGSTPNQKVQYWHSPIDGKTDYVFVLAPTFSQAFRWFREDHGLNSHIHHEDIDNYSYCCGIGYSEDIGGYQDFKTYEEAELACLDEMIKIVIKQK